MWQRQGDREVLAANAAADADADASAAWKWCFIIRYAHGLLFEMRPLRYVSISYVTLFPCFFFSSLLLLLPSSLFLFHFLIWTITSCNMKWLLRGLFLIFYALYSSAARASALSHPTFANSSHIQFIILFPFFFLRRIHISGSLVIHWKYRKLAFNWYSFSVNIRGGVETNNASRVMPLNHCISGIWALEKCSVVVASKFVL